MTISVVLTVEAAEEVAVEVPKKTVKKSKKNHLYKFIKILNIYFKHLYGLT